MINKIKSKLRSWLFSKEIDELEKLHNRVTVLSDKYERATNELYNAKLSYRDAYELMRESNQTLSQVYDVGVDVHMKDEYSWAVICLRGKPEYVKFMPLNHYDAREVMHYLRQFESSNKQIDSPFAFKDMMKDWYLK